MTPAPVLGRPRRAAWKRASERILAGAGLPRLARATRARHGIILAYHNIVPDGTDVGGDAPLHLPRRSFAAQLDHLTRHFRVVPLDRLLEGGRPAGGRPLAAITFDDAYRGAVTLGVAELVDRGLPATIFVAPALLGRPAFWWDALARPGAGLDPALRRQALGEHAGDDEAVRRLAERLGVEARDVPRVAAPADPEELEALVGLPGIAFGSHSWSHRALDALAGAALDEELERPLAWIRAHLHPAVPWLSYPYGLSSPEAEGRAAAIGYRAALRVEGGPLPRRPRNPFALPRVNVPAGVSARGFALRAAGLVN
ncbi:MAG TPA: polysaccharide deacetylase family protein [Longimicrobiales bacterium]